MDARPRHTTLPNPGLLSVSARRRYAFGLILLLCAQIAIIAVLVQAMNSSESSLTAAAIGVSSVFCAYSAELAAQMAAGTTPNVTVADESEPVPEYAGSWVYVSPSFLRSLPERAEAPLCLLDCPPLAEIRTGGLRMMPPMGWRLGSVRVQTSRLSRTSVSMRLSQITRRRAGFFWR